MGDVFFELVDTRTRGTSLETVIGLFRNVDHAVDALARFRDLGKGDYGDYIIREV